MKVNFDNKLNLILTPDNNIELFALRAWGIEFFDDVLNYESKSLSKVGITINTGIIGRTNIIINLNIDDKIE